MKLYRVNCIKGASNLFLLLFEMSGILIQIFFSASHFDILVIEYFIKIFDDVTEPRGKRFIWHNGFRFKEWVWRPKFKFWTKLFVFHSHDDADEKGNNQFPFSSVIGSKELQL